MGAQLDDCPGLADELLKLGPTKLSAAKCKQVELEDSSSDSPAPQTPIHKWKRGPTTTPTPTPAPSSHCQCHAKAVQSLILAGSSHKLQSTMSDNNSTHGSLPLASTKPLFPLANACMSTVNKGKRLFPTSYYIVNLATGFNDMDHKSLQQCPQVMQWDAFESVFGVTYMQTTYQKTHRIYNDNPTLLPRCLHTVALNAVPGQSFVKRLSQDMQQMQVLSQILTKTNRTLTWIARRVMRKRMKPLN